MRDLQCTLKVATSLLAVSQYRSSNATLMLLLHNRAAEARAATADVARIMADELVVLE